MVSDEHSRMGHVHAEAQIGNLIIFEASDRNLYSGVVHERGVNESPYVMVTSTDKRNLGLPARIGRDVTAYIVTPDLLEGKIAVEHRGGLLAKWPNPQENPVVAKVLGGLDMVIANYVPQVR